MQMIAVVAPTLRKIKHGGETKTRNRYKSKTDKRFGWERPPPRQSLFHCPISWQVTLTLQFQLACRNGRLCSLSCQSQHLSMKAERADLMQFKTKWEITESSSLQSDCCTVQVRTLTAGIKGTLKERLKVPHHPPPFFSPLPHFRIGKAMNRPARNLIGCKMAPIWTLPTAQQRKKGNWRDSVPLCRCCSKFQSYGSCSGKNQKDVPFP